VSERFHQALAGVGGAAMVLVVLLAAPAIRGEVLAIGLELIAFVVLVLVGIAELAAPRKLFIDADAICVRNAFSVDCIRRDSVTDVRVQRAPVWRGGDRIVVQTEGRVLQLPMNEEALRRLRPTA
jgi:hypothetical protein